MAGVSCAEIAQRTGARVVVRTMVNAAVEVQRSYSPWYTDGPLSGPEQALIDRVLCSVGSTDHLPNEEALEALSALSGTGPAFVALLAGALQQAGQKAGLSPAIAQRAAEAIVCDAAPLLEGKSDQADAIIARLLSYRGTTAAALAAAQENGFVQAIEQAVLKGAERARQMAKR
jgi:pyrroline-5-carboxylate reductase